MNHIIVIMFFGLGEFNPTDCFPAHVFAKAYALDYMQYHALVMCECDQPLKAEIIDLKTQPPVIQRTWEDGRYKLN